MSAILSSETVGNLVAERPSRSRVFERFGIDYCCGGKRSLAEACSKLSLDIDSVLTALGDEAPILASDSTDWTSAPLSSLTTHILEIHHAYLREALPRLSALTEKVYRAHGARHSELEQVVRVFGEFRSGMEAHAFKEEQVLFPYIARLDEAETLPTFACGSISQAIQKMEQEHGEAGDALQTLHTLTNGYAPPEGACNTYRAMLDGLAELELDTHAHVHKENSILFPRAEAREKQLKANGLVQEAVH